MNRPWVWVLTFTVSHLGQPERSFSRLVPPAEQSGSAGEPSPADGLPHG